MSEEVSMDTGATTELLSSPARVDRDIEDGDVSSTAVEASHPSQKWESAFVYAFICKFCDLRSNVEGLETPMDFEQALMFKGPDPILVSIMAGFVHNLRPAVRDPASNIDKHILNTIHEFCNRENERTIWWDPTIGKNTPPLTSSVTFFGLPWEDRLPIMRQFVDWQLVYCTRIKDSIDKAWGVRAAKHQKKSEKELHAPPPPEDPNSRENLRLEPVGQDTSRKRYWIMDDSPRIYMSGNPWKSSCEFKAISSSRGDYIRVLANLKEGAPKLPNDADERTKKSSKPRKFDTAHVELVRKLEEEQLPKVDTELIRVDRARKKAQQKIILAAQVDVRTTRTRRQTQKPDYLYDYNEVDELDDEYADTPDNDPDDFIDDGEADEIISGYKSRRSQPQRRSTRTSTVQSRGRQSDSSLAGSDFGNYRGERRSTRLGNAPKIAFDESEQPLLPAISSSKKNGSGSDRGVSNPPPPPPVASSSTSPAIVPAIIAVAPPPGKKKSKFWYYAVEAAPGAPNLNDNASKTQLQPSESLGIATNGHSGPSAATVNGGGSIADTDAQSVTENASLANGMEGIELTDGGGSANGKVSFTNGGKVNGSTHNGMDIDKCDIPRAASRASDASNMVMSEDES